MDWGSLLYLFIGMKFVPLCFKLKIMKKIIILLYIALAFTFGVNAQQNTGTGSSKCATCPGFEGITLSTSTDSKYSFDSLAKTYEGQKNIELIGGVWRYTSTVLVSKEKYLVKKLRAYYNDIDQNLYGEKKSAAQVNTAPGELDLVNTAIANVKQEKERLGRETLDPRDQLIVYDPNVDYLFLDKEGNTNDNYVIRKKTPEHTIMQLTTADIRFSFTTDSKDSKKINFTLKDFDTGISKEYVLLSLTDNEFIFCDNVNKEIQIFNRTGLTQ